MNWTIRLFWNGREVLNGAATSVCAYETARAHFEGNFAGAGFHVWLAQEMDTARTLKAIRANFHVTRVYRDETGVAQMDVMPRPVI